jgi:hypothetical protein
VIKYFLGDDHFIGQVIKSSWQFPATGSVDIPLTIGIDGNAILSGNAFGYLTWNGQTPLPVLEFSISAKKTSLDGFLLQFAKGSKFWLRFDQGTERPWILDMTGSAKVALAFRTCVLTLIRDNPVDATQPYSTPQITQPYGKPPATQPYGNKKPRMPQPQPVMKDDGSV